MKTSPIPLQEPPEILDEFGYTNLDARISWIHFYTPAPLQGIDFFPFYDYEENNNNE